MANTELLLLDAHIEWAANEIDEFVIKSDNAFVEAIDGPAAKLVLGQLNKYVSPYVADEFKPQIHVALDKVVAAEYPEAISEALTLINDIVEASQNVSPVAKEIVTAVLELIKAALMSLLQKQMESLVEPVIE